jgi:glycosyltransferase involved in cell wall biosynthesis
VVIPALHEAARLPATLDAVLAYLRRCPSAAEVVVVDDGSSDGTSALAERCGSPALPVRVLRNVTNQGKGFSGRRGILRSQDRHVWAFDAAGSTEIQTLERCWPAVQVGARVVIGSRHLPGSRIVRWQPRTRRHLSGCFRWLANRILPRPVTDIMCGFKLFEGRRPARCFRSFA